MLPRTRLGRGKRALAAVSGAALAASTLSLITAAPAQAADPVDVNVVSVNDFHGRVEQNLDKYSLFGGAGELAGAVNQMRAEYPNTVFAAAGDLIGASTFTSFIQQDKPTIDALNAAGLEVSAVGNHEFDQGYDDLLTRVMEPYDAETNPYGGAEWQYIGANVRVKSTGDPAVPESWIRDFGDVEVGFVGAVTEHLHELVTPAGIADLEVTDIVDSVNATAADLKSEGADLVVMLVHEGAPKADCATMADDPESDFGSIITGVGDDVNAIVSGHTHLAYNCSFPVAGWADRPVTERPVVSAGQYGMNLNQLVFSVDPDSGAVQGIEQNLLPLVVSDGAGGFEPAYDSDSAVDSIVADAVAAADVLGAEPLGKIAGPFKLARIADGTVNRGGESTQGNLVAEVQRWATTAPESGSAQLAVINPGGLREDLLGLDESGYPATLTYQQAATAQPFANTLVNMQMTGAQVKTMLEQQWQPEAASRPFLKLGTSHGFTYTYDPDAPNGEHILQMWLDGEEIVSEQSYSVTANSFLASGGDNFAVFKEAASHQDTGKTDLQAMVDYLAAFGTEEAPLAVDYDQHAVGTSGSLRGAPGSTLSFDLSSFSFSNADDVKDSDVAVWLGDVELGSFPLDNTVAADPFDETGQAAITVDLPTSLATGAHALTLRGSETGTSIDVPIRVAKATSTTKVKVTPKKVVAKKTKAKVKVTVRAGDAKASGKVRVRAGGKVYTATLKNGKAKIKLKPFKRAGKQKVTVRYLGDATTLASTDKVTIKVAKAKKGKKGKK